MKLLGPQKLSTVRRPGMCLAFVDVFQNDISRRVAESSILGNYYTSNAYYLTQRAPHTQRANVAFVDGHIRTMWRPQSNIPGDFHPYSYFSSDSWSWVDQKTATDKAYFWNRLKGQW